MKSLTSRMNDIDKRVQSLEDAEADDEGDTDGSSKGKKCKKRKRKVDGPSKDISYIVMQCSPQPKEWPLSLSYG